MLWQGQVIIGTSHLTHLVQMESHDRGMSEGCRRLDIGFFVKAAFALADGCPVTRTFRALAAITWPFPTPALAGDIDILN